MKVDLRKFKATRYPKGLPFEVEEEDWEKIHEIPLRPGSTLRQGWYRLEHAQNAKAVLVAIFGVPRKAGPCVLCNNSKPSSTLNFTNCLVFPPELARLANQKDNTCCNCIWRHNYDQCCKELHSKTRRKAHCKVLGDVKGNAKRSGSARLLQELQPDRGFHSPDPRESTRASDTSRRSRGLTEDAQDDNDNDLDDDDQPIRGWRRHGHKDAASKPHHMGNSNSQLVHYTPPSSRPSLAYQELHRGRGGPPVPRTAIWEKSPTDDDKNLLIAVAIVCNKHAINTKTDVCFFHSSSPLSQSPRLPPPFYNLPLSSPSSRRRYS